jgi:choline dehydrogenase-like flavoprotein
MGQRYDVVIVGAGSAGCALAGRLSDDPRRTVLLIEAGPSGSTPATRSDSFFDAIADSGRTYPGVMVQRTRGAPLTPYLLGRGMGGSSAINGMIGTIGSQRSYDRWETELGCVGWSYSDLAGKFGVMSLMAHEFDRLAVGSVDHALIAAAKSFGHPTCKNPFVSDVLGVGPAALTRWNGRRVTAADTYLAKAGERSNLTIRPDCDVARVLLAETTAVGVELVGGEVVDAAEVIVSAGAIHSPLLLLRSHVERSGIGVGLKDHPSATLTLRRIHPADTSMVAAAALLRWSSPGHVGDLQALSMNHVGVAEYGALVIGLMEVQSSGTLELVDGLPVIRFGMLEDERDLIRLRDATRHLGSIARSQPFQAVADAILIDGIGTPLDALDDEEFIDDWLHDNVGAYVHASSTCRMGPVDDPSRVVDMAGRVHGYANLRVCDASIFPDIPNANLHLPTMAVAERIADLIIAGV